MSFSAALLNEMVNRRKAGHSLESPFYLSPEILRADIDLIFGRHWIFVGVSPQVAEAGDYFTVDIGSHSVVIVRDDDMQVRAFHNVCRHRGSRLCSADRGTVGNIVCPYHQWTYDLTGKLINADHMGDGFDRNQHGLKPVHLRNLEGLLFVCLADEPPSDFDEVMKVIAPYIAPHRLDECKLAQQIDIVENGNWKLTMENNRECYHCMVCHPELTVAMFEEGFGYAPGPQNASGMARFEKVVADSHARWEAMGLPSREIDHLNDTASGYRVMRLPLDRAGESYTMDSHVACKRLLGDFTDPKLGGLSVWTQPNSWHHFLSDYVVSFAALPIDADHTLVRTTWCVHKDAAEGRDYDVDNLTRVWRATNEQDGKLVEEVQRGAACGAYEPGPYSPFTEGLVEKFVDWYVGRLRSNLK